MSDDIKKCPKCGNECGIGDLYCIKCSYKFGSEDTEKLDRMKRVDDYTKNNTKEDIKEDSLDVTMKVDLTYEEAIEGTQKTIVLDYFDPPKEIKVNIPASVKNGTKIKLDGEGYENEKGDVGDLYIIINISRGVSYYSNESNSGTIWIIILIVIGIIGFAIFKFLSSTNVDSEIANNMPKPLGCDNYSIKSSVINNFKENNLYYKYIDESSISEIDLLYPSETQFDEENGIYYCKGVITVKSNQDGFKPTSDNDKNNYYSNIHQVNNENGEEKLLKYTKYEYNIEYKSYISDGEPTIEVINSSDNNVGEFYCNGSCEPEIIKEAEVYNTHEEDYSNNYNYDENNVNYEKESTQNRSQNNTKQRSYNNVDFSNYMSNIENRIKNNWYPPKSNTTSRAVVLFELNRNGEVISAKIKQSSGNALCDKAAISAIENTHFDPLPSEYEGDSVPIEFSFDYNVVNRR